MPATSSTSSLTRLARPGPVVVAVAVVLLTLGLGAVSGGSEDRGRQGASAPVEPILGDQIAAPIQSPHGSTDSSRSVARPRPHGAGQGSRAREDGGPPAHIRRENAEIRQQLDHLEALEAERKGVSDALAAADTVDGKSFGRLAWPLSGPMTSPFGERWGRLHAGVDIAAAGGTPIRAAASGRVALAGWQGGYGLYTCIRHTTTLSTCYAHQSRLGTTAGAVVRQGQVIGFVGNTGHSFGEHLHFETWVNGEPVDPMRFL
jgi:murein DD-endopeptidase MepM/ murein hydrolase activator NlpD